MPSHSGSWSKGKGRSISMGWHENITADKFPKQGILKDRRCTVLFNYGPPELTGTVVRDDVESPGLMIIKLDDGRYILSTECQYAPE